MPNYTYQCQDCSSVFDIRASIKEMERGNFPCTKCGSKNIKRLFNGFGFWKSTGASTSSSSSCASCRGGNCSTCH